VTGPCSRRGFAKAFERSRNALNGGKWEGLVSEYVNDFPEVADDVSEYQQLTSSRALTAEFAERMATSVPTPPEYHDRSVLSDETPKPTAGDTMRAMLSAAPRGPALPGRRLLRAMPMTGVNVTDRARTVGTMAASAP
jgi:hypothetical protein